MFENAQVAGYGPQGSTGLTQAPSRSFPWVPLFAFGGLVVIVGFALKAYNAYTRQEGSTDRTDIRQEGKTDRTGLRQGGHTDRTMFRNMRKIETKTASVAGRSDRVDRRHDSQDYNKCTKRVKRVTCLVRGALGRCKKRDTKAFQAGMRQCATLTAN